MPSSITPVLEAYIHIGYAITTHLTHNYCTLLLTGFGNFPRVYRSKSKSKLYYDRQSVGQRLGVRHPPGTRDQFFFLLEIFFRQL
jgi:hypothetical protein